MHDFEVALSFAGEQRPLAAAVADCLAAALGRDKVFYDRFHEAQLARLDLDIYLQAVYQHGSRLVVVIVGKDYNRKEWPGLEWRAVRDLIQQKATERIVLVRVDDAPVAGVFDLDGYLDAQRLGADQIAARILERLRSLEATSAPEQQPDSTASSASRAPSPALARPGRASRFLVFEGDVPLPDQEFAIELLTEPIVLRRDASGGLRILVNRDHVAEALYTTAGKREICSDVLGSPERLDAARRLDREIHEFLIGDSRDSQLVIHRDHLPLRWASGGVLSVVRWRGHR